MQQIIDIQDKYMKYVNMNEHDDNELNYKLKPNLQEFYSIIK